MADNTDSYALQWEWYETLLIAYNAKKLLVYCKQGLSKFSHMHRDFGPINERVYT